MILFLCDICVCVCVYGVYNHLRKFDSRVLLIGDQPGMTERALNGDWQFY